MKQLITLKLWPQSPAWRIKAFPQDGDRIDLREETESITEKEREQGLH